MLSRKGKGIEIGLNMAKEYHFAAKCTIQVENQGQMLKETKVEILPTPSAMHIKQTIEMGLEMVKE